MVLLPEDMKGRYAVELSWEGMRAVSKQKLVQALPHAKVSACMAHGVLGGELPRCAHSDDGLPFGSD